MSTDAKITSSSDRSTRDSSVPAPSPFPTLAIPLAVKQVFDRFPRVTFRPNALPFRTLRHRNKTVLFVFAGSTSNDLGGPSSNPNCLKWQAYLNFNRVQFRTVASTNHASPSGSLPFLVPANSSSADVPISARNIPKWTAQNNFKSASSSLGPTETAYNVLLTTSIRLAYLHALYLHPPTFSCTAAPLYLRTASSSALIQHSLEQSLQKAALDEILSVYSDGAGLVDVRDLFVEAKEAWTALSVFLGQHEFFSQAARQRNARGTMVGEVTDEEMVSNWPAFRGKSEVEKVSSRDLHDGVMDGPHECISTSSDEEGPGLLDAAVFAYIHVIRSLAAGQEVEQCPLKTLANDIDCHANLSRYERRIVESYFSSGSSE